MLTITGINNNANSVRIYNHTNVYNKNDLLIYADNIRRVKYAYINAYNKRAVLSHKINSGRAAIAHTKPQKREHLLYIQQCLPIEIIDYETMEYYNNIIVAEGVNTPGINNSNYCETAAIIGGADSLAGEIIDILAGVGEYETTADAIADHLCLDDVTAEQATETEQAARNYWNNKCTFNEYAAALLSIYTGKKWNCETIRGCCQSDWANIIYPADEYGQTAINEFECYYFGLYWEYRAIYNGFDTWYTFTDNTPEQDIINEIAADYPTNNVKYSAY